MEFKGKVDGRSAVEVLAPGGTVTFDPPSLTDEVGAKIDGESRVAITARDVRFRSILNGTDTRVSVTLTKGGRLQFKDMDGSVRLHYRKADPGDPDPTVERGGVRGAAEVKQGD